MSTKKNDTKRRGNHAGRLELRGKKWLAIWMVNGKRQSQSTGLEDRAAAEKWLARKLEAVKTADGLRQLDKDAETIRAMQATVLGSALADLDRQRDAIKAREPALRFDEAWTAYERTPKRKNVTPQTLDHLRARFAAFKTWMTENHPGVEELRDVTTEIAAAYAAHIRPDYVPTTYNMTLAALSQVWTTLAAEIKAKLNPWSREYLTRQTGHESARRIITDAELAVIFEKARHEVPPLHYMFTVMLYTGARMGDCACLKWEYIDLARGFISFVPIKMRRYGNRARVKIPILPPLRAMLESYPAGSREGYVMPDMATAYEAGTLSDTITDFLRTKCDIKTSVKTDPTKRARPVVGAHSFRHTFVSKAANAGIPFAIVQQIVGHQTAEMCRHYFHEDEDATLRAFAAFPVQAPAQIENRGDVIDVEAEVKTTKPTAADRRAALKAALEDMRRDGDDAERAWAAGILAKIDKELGAK